MANVPVYWPWRGAVVFSGVLWCYGPLLVVATTVAACRVFGIVARRRVFNRRGTSLGLISTVAFD